MRLSPKGGRLNGPLELGEHPGVTEWGKDGSRGEGGLLRREKEESELSIRCGEVPNAGALAPLSRMSPPPPTLQLPLSLSSCGIHVDQERKHQLRVLLQHPRPGRGPLTEL